MVCLVRDWVPQSELVRAALIERVKVVRGDVRDQALLERVLGEYEIDTVIHLAAQTIVGDREPQSGVDVRDEHRAARGRCSRRAAAARAVEADRRRLVGQGVRRPRRSCPTTRTRRCAAAIPTTSASRAPT